MLHGAIQVGVSGRGVLRALPPVVRQVDSYYLDLRLCYSIGSDPQVRQQTQELVRTGKGIISIHEADLVMDFELLCEQGFIHRERTDAL